MVVKRKMDTSAHEIVRRKIQEFRTTHGHEKSSKGKWTLDLVGGTGLISHRHQKKELIIRAKKVHL